MWGYSMGFIINGFSVESRSYLFRWWRSRKHTQNLPTSHTGGSSLDLGAEGEPQAWQRYHSFCKKWLATQPKAVGTLQPGFELTLAYFLIQTQAAERGEAWPDTALRTTSHLERENRNFRRRHRQAGLFHSYDGLAAAVFKKPYPPAIPPIYFMNEDAVGEWYKRRRRERRITIGQKREICHVANGRNREQHTDLNRYDCPSSVSKGKPLSADAG
jgi:hypothetical protein